MNLFDPSPVASEPRESRINWSYWGMSFQVLVLLLALVVFLSWGIDHFKHYDKQRKIYVNLSLDEGKERALGRILFAADDIREAWQGIEELAWVQSVRIRRRAHNHWMITMEESSPFATLKERGYLFADGSALKGSFPLGKPLPEAVGPMEQLTRLAPTLHNISSRLRERDLVVRRFEVEHGGGLLLTLDDDKLVFFGSRDHMPRLARFLRFATIYMDELGRAQKLDLRYDNALAITWRAL